MERTDGRAAAVSAGAVEGATATCGVCGLVPEVSRFAGTTQVVAESAAMRAVLVRTARFARSRAPVVVTGETGTGKEVVARVLHASSPRAAGPFVAVNVAALPAELLESELFGHEKGAFTGATAARRGLVEAASGGTLFLDEIGEMPLPLQAKLLRVVQDGEVRRVGESRAFAVDVRIVCATHRDLGARVAEGAFREDLYYRLRVLGLEVPPLRARREDVLPLARRFLAEEAEAEEAAGGAGAVGGGAGAGGRGARVVPRRFSSEVEARLLAHDWPGNVRELQNAVRHGLALASGAVVEAADLPETVGARVGRADAGGARRGLGGPGATGGVAGAAGGVGDGGRCSAGQTLAEVERAHVLAVLAACGGAQAEAARVLGIGRNTLWRKLARYG